MVLSGIDWCCLVLPKTTRASCDCQLLLVVAPSGSLSRGGRGTRRRPSAVYSALGYTLHWILVSCSRSAPPHAPASFRGCEGSRPAASPMRRVTSAKRGRWAVSRTQWLDRDQLVGGLKKDEWIAPPLEASRAPPPRLDPSAPRTSSSSEKPKARRARRMTSRRGSAVVDASL